MATDDAPIYKTPSQRGVGVPVFPTGVRAELDTVEPLQRTEPAQSVDRWDETDDTLRTPARG